MQTQPAEPPLPAGWYSKVGDPSCHASAADTKLKFDPNYGQNYYVNSSTGNTQWTHPSRGVGDPQASMPPQRTGSAPPNSGLDAYPKLFDPVDPNLAMAPYSQRQPPSGMLDTPPPANIRDPMAHLQRNYNSQPMSGGLPSVHMSQNMDTRSPNMSQNPNSSNPMPPRQRGLNSTYMGGAPNASFQQSNNQRPGGGMRPGPGPGMQAPPPRGPPPISAQQNAQMQQRMQTKLMLAREQQLKRKIQELSQANQTAESQRQLANLQRAQETLAIQKQLFDATAQLRAQTQQLQAAKNAQGRAELERQVEATRARQAELARQQTERAAQAREMNVRSREMNASSSERLRLGVECRLIWRSGEQRADGRAAAECPLATRKAKTGPPAATAGHQQ
jgi:hypothetical protein